MTETQWLTSDNPAEMVAFLGERITDEQRYRIDDAYQDILRGPSLSTSLHADAIRDIVGNPFIPLAGLKSAMEAGIIAVDADYPVRVFDPKNNSVGWSSYEWDELDFNNARHIAASIWQRHCIKPFLEWNNRTIPLMVDAMMNEDCPDNDEHESPCDYCHNTGRIPRAEPRWSDMLEIADALEEAGCTEQLILNWLRGWESCPWCGGSGDNDVSTWVIGYPVCSNCNGTGKRTIKHVIGDWCVELLKGK